uniref:Uncharacterized protein n=1 Tax=Glossina palpalis gambiensis TaxID=67801 RepID=A0A1B0BK96_9MUSC
MHDAILEFASLTCGKVFFTGCVKNSLLSTSFSKGAIIFVDNVTLRLGKACSAAGINMHSLHVSRLMFIRIFKKNQTNSKDLIMSLCAAAIELKLNPSHLKKDYLKDLLTFVLLVVQLKVGPKHPIGEVLRDRREESAFTCSLSLRSLHDVSFDVLAASCFGGQLSALFSDISATTFSLSSIFSSQEAASVFMLTNFGKQFSFISEESLDPLIKSSNGEILCAEEMSSILDSFNSNMT